MKDLIEQTGQINVNDENEDAEEGDNESEDPKASYFLKSWPSS